MSEENKQNNQQQLFAKPEDLRGNYANALQVTAQDRDVVIDFISSVNVNGSMTASLVSRIFLNHHVAKDLATILNGVLVKWEERKYSLPPTPPAEPPKK